MKNRVVKKLLFLGKLLLMLVLLAWVADQVHWRDNSFTDSSGGTTIRPGLISCLQSFNPWLFLVALILQCLTIFLTALRWRLLMVVQGIVLGVGSVLRLSFLGEFFNNLLPGSMGGDLVKAYYVIKRSGKKGATLVSLFANRFAGLLAMVLVSLLMLLACLVPGLTTVDDLKEPAYSIFLIGGAIVVVLFIALSERINNSPLLHRLIARLPFSRQLQVLREAVHLHRKMGAWTWPVLLYSFATVFALILTGMFLGISLDIKLEWYCYFLYLPLIMILTAVPITPGAIGVMEELFLYFFSSAGDPQKILTLALLFRLVIVISSLPGAWFFLHSYRADRRELREGINRLEADPERD